jgi:hypothetical protein
MEDMHRSDRNYLFSKGDLFSALGVQTRSVSRLVEEIPRDQFLATSVDTLVEHLVAKLAIDPLVLHEDQMSMEHSEIKIDVTGRFEYGGSLDGRPIHVDGHQLTFHLPFSGDAQLWDIRPNLLGAGPQGEVDARRKVLTLLFKNTANTEQQWYQNELKSSLQLIRQSIDAQSSMLAQYQKDLPARVRDAVSHRRGQVSKLHDLVAAFNIPMARKAGMPDYRPVDVQKIKTVAALPHAPAAGFKPEPAITDELYEEILSNIRHMGATFEGTPQTYQPLGEEGLRDIILASLNGVYQGAATGEAFRKYGKPDLRIEEQSRSAFVGECKLWGGERVLISALEQLLDYTTWRDGKAALIMFNKSVAGFAGLQETIAKALPAHGLFLRDKGCRHMGEHRFAFRTKEDEGREITIHAFCFNLYVSPERSEKRR